MSMKYHSKNNREEKYSQRSTNRRGGFFRKRECIYCTEKIEVDYKDVDHLRRLLTERGKILPKAKTRTCSKHQRGVTVAVKRARFMALIPYTVKVED